MIDTKEPKNGDFVAYIEQLQRQSAARLLGSNHHLITQLDKNSAGSGAKGEGHFFAGRKPAEMRSAAQMQATHAPRAAPIALGPLAIPALPIGIGALLAFYWLFASSSVGLIALAIGLIIWGIKRVMNALPEEKVAPAQVAKIFSEQRVKPVVTKP